jgi:hypothetical protein
VEVPSGVAEAINEIAASSLEGVLDELLRHLASLEDMVLKCDSNNDGYDSPSVFIGFSRARESAFRELRCRGTSCANGLLVVTIVLFFS